MPNPLRSARRRVRLRLRSHTWLSCGCTLVKSGDKLTRGCAIALAGPDGTGKTTIGDALAARASQAGIPVSRFHYRPGLIGGRVEGSSATVTPHAQAQRPLLSGVLKLLVVALDMTVGYLVRWRRPRRRGLLIVERGWWDMAVDPRRYRLSPRLVGLVRRVGAIVPRPDLLVVLAGDAEAINARKPEIGVDEVTRQLQAWEGIAHVAARRVLRLDTVAHSREAVTDAIFDAVGIQPRDDVRRVPLTPRRLELMCAARSSAAAQLYQPFHPIRRALTPVAFAAARAGFTPCADVPFDVPALCRHLRVASDGFVLMRSSGAGRWIVGACFDDTLSAVLKVGQGDDYLLRNEIATLTALQDCSPAGIRVPRVRWQGRWGDRLVLALDPVPQARTYLSLDDAVELCNAMVMGTGDVPPVVHGDFAPWNVHGHRPQAVVLDWEQARFERAPLFDLSHFVIIGGALLHRLTPQQAVTSLCAVGSAGARHLTEVGEDPADAADFVRRYLASIDASSEPVARFRADVERCLSAGVRHDGGR